MILYESEIEEIALKLLRDENCYSIPLVQAVLAVAPKNPNIK